MSFGKLGAVFGKLGSGGRGGPLAPDPDEPAPPGFQWLLGADGQYLRGSDNEYLYGIEE